jgi:predicted transcriptional regulator
MSPEPDIRVYRPDQEGIRKVLGGLEAEIMELIWTRPAREGATVRDVFETLSKRRRIAYTTVMTTMARLARKKLLRAKRHGQAYVYFPNFTEEEFISRFVGRVLESLLISFSGVTLERLKAISGPRAGARARRFLARIARRRAAEES